MSNTYQLVWNGWRSEADRAAEGAVRQVLLEDCGIDEAAIQHLFAHPGAQIREANAESELLPASQKLTELGARVLLVRPIAKSAADNEIEFKLDLLPLNPALPQVSTADVQPLVIETLDLSLDQPIVPQLASPPVTQNHAQLDDPIIPAELRAKSATLMHHNAPLDTAPELEPTVETLPVAASQPTVEESSPPPEPAAPTAEEPTTASTAAPNPEDDTPLAHRRRTANITAAAELEIPDETEAAHPTGWRHRVAEMRSIILGIALLGLGNWAYFSLQEETPVPQLVVPKSLGQPKTQAAPPAPPTQVPEPTPTVMVGFGEAASGTNPGAQFSTTWQLDFRNDTPEHLVLTIVAAEPPPPTTEEIVNNTVRRFVRKVEIESTTFTGTPPATITSQALARIYISENGQSRRIVGQSTLTLQLNPQTQAIQGEIWVTTRETPAAIPSGILTIEATESQNLLIDLRGEFGTETVAHE